MQFPSFRDIYLCKCKNLVHGAWFFCHAGKSQIYLKNRVSYLKTNIDRTYRRMNVKIIPLFCLLTFNTNRALPMEFPYSYIQ